MSLLTKIYYSLGETFGNLRRHLLLAVASVLTVAVSLSLVGGALLLRAGVDNATARWQGGVEFEVFLVADASAAAVAGVRDDLLARPEVRSVEYVSQDEQYELFKILFANRPEYLENVGPSTLPASYRVEPETVDPDQIEAVGVALVNDPAVREVVFAEETVRALMALSSSAQQGIFGVAAVLLLSASLLIFNTVRLAIFSRRNDIEIMKLVGASNWYVRVPFMAEGLVHGLVGGAVALGVVHLVSSAAQEALRTMPMFASFILIPTQVNEAGLVMLAIGAFLGVFTAGVAVTRYLDAP